MHVLGTLTSACRSLADFISELTHKNLLLGALGLGVAVGATPASAIFLDDFSTDTSPNYTFENSYGAGGSHDVSGGTLNITTGNGNTAMVTLTAAQNLAVGESLGVDVPPQSGPNGLFLTLGTALGQPGAAGGDGYRWRRDAGPTGGLEIFQAAAGSIITAADPDKSSPATLWIDRTASDTFEFLFQLPGSARSSLGTDTYANLDGVTDLNIGMQAFDSTSTVYSFDNLRIVDTASIGGMEPPKSPNTWTLIGIGDTQVLVETVAGAQAFNNMTQWAVDNQETENVMFVTQLGDIVQNGFHGRPNTQAQPPNNVDEWDRAEAAMSILENASIPWGTGVGNHELDWVDIIPGVVPSSNWWAAQNPGVPVPPSGFEEWKRRFGPVTSGRYDDVPEFGGAAANDVDTYFIYNAGGRDYLHLHLQVDIPDATIAWAQGIIDANPGKPTLISTHVFEGTQHGPPNNPYLSGPGRNSANQVWDELIKDNSQIFMVLNGHTGQQVRQTRTNTAGKDVFTISQDYAGFGNSGYMRLYEFDEVNNVIHAKTYSPTLDAFLTSSSHQFDLPLNFFARFDTLLLGDLDSSEEIDEQDWILFRNGHLQDLSGLSPAQQYGMGDLDADGDNDVDDFLLFNTAFDDANGAGAFSAMFNSVPEPSSLALLGLGACLLGMRRAGRPERTR